MNGGREPVEKGNGEAAHRGWLPPEDRLWRHPSEVVAGAGEAPGTAGGGAPTGPPQRGRRRRRASVLVVGAAAAAILVGVLFLVNSSSPGPNAPLAGPTSTTAATGDSPPLAALGERQSMVSLQISGPGGKTQGNGVAVAAGGLVATTADAVRHAKTISAVTSSGQHASASVVAMDDGSDLALLRVGNDLPLAHFSDDGSLQAGKGGWVLALTPDHSGVTTRWAATTLESITADVSSGAASGMASIDATMAGVPSLAGALLLDHAGNVIGLLDTSAPALNGAAVFLPTVLVLGVSGDLASSGKVDHGWLEISGHDAAGSGTTTTTAPTLSGVTVASVDQHGTSAAALKVGDVIVGANGAPVRTMAELRTRLYVLGPGTPVQLSVWREGKAVTVEVDLAPSP